MKNTNTEQKVLKFLADNPGEQMDIAIAKAISVAIDTLRICLKELEARNQIVLCHLTRFVQGQKLEGLCCRLAGFAPPAKAGRKPAAP
jgi:hypothetical protein